MSVLVYTESFAPPGDRARCGLTNSLALLLPAAAVAPSAPDMFDYNEGERASLCTRQSAIDDRGTFPRRS